MSAAARFVTAVVLAAMPLVALAQADNSNAITGSDRMVVASVARNDPLPAVRGPRDEPRRRQGIRMAGIHVAHEGLTAAELGLLYGTDFAFGAGAEGPVPVPSP